MHIYTRVGVAVGAIVGISNAISLRNQIYHDYWQYTEVVAKGVGYGVLWPFSVGLIVTDGIFGPKRAFMRHWRLD